GSPVPGGGRPGGGPSGGFAGRRGGPDLTVGPIGKTLIMFSLPVLGSNILLSLTVGVAGGILTPHILDAMRTPLEARADAIAYLRVIFAAMPFMYFFSFVMMAQRGTGDSKTPFYFSLLAVGMDIVLNPLLIMGIGPFPKLGIAGSATSTLIAQ